MSDESKKYKFHYKLVFWFVCMTTIASLMLSSIIYFTSKRRVFEDMRLRLLDFISVARLQIDADSHGQLIDSKQEGGDTYKKVRKELQRIRNSSPDIRYVYTMRYDTKKNDIRFVVDAEDEKVDEIAHLGDKYSDASDFLKTNVAVLDKPVVEQGFYSDKWGTWLSGYAPFYNEDGDREGIVGVDIAATKVKAYQNTLLKRTAFAFAASLVLSLIMGWILGRKFARPIEEIKNGAVHISEGDFTTRIDVKSNDEIGDLARTFNVMTEKLQDSYDKLREEVAMRQKMEEKYRAIFDNAIEGIFQSSVDGEIITANNAFTEMFGSTIQDVRKDLYVNEEDRDAFVSNLRKNGKVTDYKTLLKGQAENDVWVNINARLVADHQGGEIIEGTVHNITETIERENAEKAKQTAEAMARAKSEFLSHMSHEIRTPINAIIGLSELMLQTELTSRQFNYINKLQSSSKNLVAIVNDILDYSKIEAGKLEIESIEFDLKDVFNNLSNVVSLKAAQKELEILFDISSEVPQKLLGDPVRLGQVLINLGNNAVKFTEKGYVVFRVNRVKIEDRDITLRFSVKDTGMGIAKEQIDKLFSAFTQADSSITRKHGGTGLGLTICKQLVTLMNGEISVESELGEGAEFIFTARFKVVPDDSSQVRFQPPRKLYMANVLVVDDNSISRKILGENLQNLSFKVDEASSGEQALEMLSSQDKDYELIFMDWKMPGLDGLQTFEEIKNKSEGKKIPAVLMVSAYNFDDIRETAHKIGIKSFLNKPVNASYLYNTIMEVYGEDVGPSIDGFGKKRIPAEAQEIAGANVLLVEDNKINQQVSKELLESRGVKVTIAQNGREAVDLIVKERFDFDVVLMDVQMPVMDGVEATKTIRASEVPNKNIPIVALTAHAIKAEKERCLAAGMNGHLSKPIQMDKLVAFLKKWIARDVDGESPVGGGDELENWPELKGIAVSEGMKHVAGNVKLYGKLLVDFQRSFHDAPENIRKLVSEREFQAARELLHKIKGAAANLAISGVGEISDEFEQSLSENENDGCEKFLQRFHDECDVVMASIDLLKDVVLEAEDVVTGEANCREEDILPFVEQLAEKLKIGSSESEDCLKRLAPLKGKSEFKDLIVKLEAEIGDFDFDLAERTLTIIKNKMKG